MTTNERAVWMLIAGLYGAVHKLREGSQIRTVSPADAAEQGIAFARIIDSEAPLANRSVEGKPAVMRWERGTVRKPERKKARRRG